MWGRDGALTPQQQWGDVGPGWGSVALTAEQQWGDVGQGWGSGALTPQQQWGDVGPGWDNGTIGTGIGLGPQGRVTP